MPDPSHSIPCLETARLTLRGPCLDDFADSASMWADPEVTRFIGGRPYSEEETWSRLLRYAGHWALMGFGYWVVREKATGRFAGEIGFADFRREITPSIVGTPEIGWVLATWAHGQGFATEAARAAIEWGETHFGSARTVCLIHPENLPSLRLAGKIGYLETGRTSYKDQPTIVFHREMTSG